MQYTHKIAGISVIGAALLALSGAMVFAAVFDTGEPGNAARGVNLWASYCDGCHNARDPKEFRDDQWRATMAHMKVRAGLPGQDARDILAFLQQANNPAPTSDGGASAGALPTVAGDPESGREVYNSICVACHSEDGRGLISGVPDFTARDSRLAQSDDVLIQHITEGYQSPGSPMAMPPRGGDPDLTDQDLRDALSFIRDQFEG